MDEGLQNVDTAEKDRVYFEVPLRSKQLVADDIPKLFNMVVY